MIRRSLTSKSKFVPVRAFSKKMFKMYSIYVYAFLILVLASSDIRRGFAFGYRLNGRADAVAALSDDDYRNRKIIDVPHDKEAENLKDAEVVWLNPGKRGSPNFTPYISVGVLSNLEEFFENLSSNMNSLDEDRADENAIQDQQSRLKNPFAEHYLRGYKPSYKIRNYVQSPELGLLKGTNRYDPSLMWTGLGKRSGT